MSSVPESKVRQAREKLDAHVRETMQWHFSPETGSPFWLDWARKAGWDPRKEVKSYADIARFDHFQDDALRGGPVNRWIPKGLAGKPAYVFVDDFRIDYEQFSHGLPDTYFPKGSNWLMLGPSGPRRLRLAVEHMCQYRGGICFMVDLDPRWVVKLIKKGWMEHLKAYQEHVIDQAITVLSAKHDIKCMFTTPKLLEALAVRLEKDGSSIVRSGIKGIFCGGTEMTAQWIRFAIEEYLEGGKDVYIAPTYGNTLMGLAAAEMPKPPDYKIAYYAPEPRAVVEVVDFDNYEKTVDFGKDGRVMLTTLTKEFFVPRFLERDEGVRELPSEKYPWPGVSGVKPFREIAATTTVGVY
jgi:hypothetical protein